MLAVLRPFQGTEVDELASQTEIIRLIGMTYDLIEDDCGFDDLLPELSLTLGAACSNICSISDGVVDYRSETVPDDFLQNVYLPVLETDLWYTRAQNMTPGVVLRNTDLATPAEYRRTEHFWINYKQDFEHMAGICALSDSFDLQYFVTCLRSPAAKEHPDQNLDVLRQLKPHLDRMFRYRENVRIDVHRMAQPAIVIENMRCIDANRSAEQLVVGQQLHGGQAVPIRLLRNERDNRRLMREFQQASAEPRLIRLGDQRALLVPQSYLKASCARSLRYVLVFLVDAPSVNVDLVERLTPAEKQVAQKLCQGLSVADIAADRERSVDTIRSQVKSMMRKVGVRSQAQLVISLMNRA